MYTGVHKVMAVYKYDKRPVNGAAFVYHRTQLREIGKIERSIIDYTTRALDALGVKIGAAHIEIMQTKKGPMLIEYNGRWHLTDFKPLCDECIGYNALDATLDAYLDQEVCSKYIYLCTCGFAAEA